MAKTITQAIALVRRYLDEKDTSNQRWDSDDIKDVLAAQLDRTVHDYLKYNPSGRLTEKVTGTASAGVLDLSSEKPQRLWSVYWVKNTKLQFIEQLDAGSQWMRDTSDRNLELRMVRTFELSTTDSHPLVGVGATAREIPSLDRVICLRAAQELSIEDREGMPFATDVLKGYEATLFSHGDVNDIATVPTDPAPYRDNDFDELGWSYDHNTEELQLWRLLS